MLEEHRDDPLPTRRTARGVRAPSSSATPAAGWCAADLALALPGHGAHLQVGAQHHHGDVDVREGAERVAVALTRLVPLAVEDARAALDGHLEAEPLRQVERDGRAVDVDGEPGIVDGDAVLASASTGSSGSSPGTGASGRGRSWLDSAARSRPPAGGRWGGDRSPGARAPLRCSRAPSRSGSRRSSGPRRRRSARQRGRDALGVIARGGAPHHLGGEVLAEADQP